MPASGRPIKPAGPIFKTMS
ncbi:hypothetical protein EN837_17920 [bacterium M00.F.Ca.ET.194.01.1.1]|nr:hypothetical protein EN837_17920 [bacterium M00.F.Ca.ET.194.01.1.1]TGS53836.1 hypothetical protein EN822_17915 [bacterium M00.F.Ca.ET.179.01.1.1]TGV46596.1 hypothetical protein EN811_17915 [bacterium M00.F.Ca.ET.168.01.1.1]